MLVYWYLNLLILIVRVNIYLLMGFLGICIFSLELPVYTHFILSVCCLVFWHYIWSVLFVVNILPGLYLFYEKQKVLFLFRIINYLLLWFSIYKVFPPCEKHLYFLLVYYFISFLHWSLEFMLNSSIFWWVALGRNLIFFK